MDQTLVEKVPGRFPDLNASACRAPLLRWLGLGGRLFVVTSDDGYRPFNHLWGQIPAGLRANGRVLLSTGGGATIFSGDADGEVVEVREFWDEVGAGISSPARATVLACDMARYTLVAALRKRLAQDGSRAGANPVDDLHSAVIDAFLAKNRGWAARPIEELEARLLSTLSDAALLARHGVLNDKTLVWRNQPGPPESWAATWGGNGTFATRLTNVFIMGTPPHRAQPTLDAFRARIFGNGIAASSAPSTICLRSRTIDKSVPVAWLDRRSTAGDAAGETAQSSFGFALDDAVAIGDNPLGNDAPLATFGRYVRRVGAGALDNSGNAALERGGSWDESEVMAFVSVGEAAAEEDGDADAARRPSATRAEEEERALAALGRRALQQRAKALGIRANQTSAAIVAQIVADVGGGAAAAQRASRAAERAAALLECGVMFGAPGFERGTAKLIARWSDVLEAQQREEGERGGGGSDRAPRRRFFTDEVVHDAVLAAGGWRIE